MIEKKTRGDIGHIRISLKNYNFNILVENTNINSQTDDKSVSIAW